MDAVPADDVLAPLTLVVGDEELLVARAVSETVRAARAADADAEVRDLLCAELQRGDVLDALSPSLFGGRRVVVLRAAQDLPKDLVDEVVAAAGDVPDETSLVVVHAGGAKGKALLTALAATKPRRVDVPKVTRPSERREFVKRELRRDGRQVDDDAVTLLLEAVGNDLRELASAAEQLLVDTTGPITTEAVARYHRGRAEASGFAVADRAVEGDLAGALELARWGTSTGLAPVLVTSALASTLRSVAIVASSAGVPAGQLAAQVGMPPWKVDKTRKQARGWHPDALATALRAVARADADVKGGAVSAPYAVEKALVAVVTARSGR
ncbi:MAG: DNA polymerase III subunit delta [Actinomycetes bacterium]